MGLRHLTSILFISAISMLYRCGPSKTDSSNPSGSDDWADGIGTMVGDASDHQIIVQRYTTDQDLDDSRKFFLFATPTGSDRERSENRKPLYYVDRRPGAEGILSFTPNWHLERAYDSYRRMVPGAYWLYLKTSQDSENHPRGRSKRNGHYYIGTVQFSGTNPFAKVDAAGAHLAHVRLAIDTAGSDSIGLHYLTNAVDNQTYAQPFSCSLSTDSSCDTFLIEEACRDGLSSDACLPVLNLDGALALSVENTQIRKEGLYVFPLADLNEANMPYSQIPIPEDASCEDSVAISLTDGFYGQQSAHCRATMLTDREAEAGPTCLISYSIQNPASISGHTCQVTLATKAANLRAIILFEPNQ